jgi:hypothetical protein
MMKLKSIEEEWNDFTSKVFDGTQSEIQVVEMKRAFFAGATALMCNVIDIGEDDSMSEEDSVKYLESVNNELGKFWNVISDGIREGV